MSLLLLYRRARRPATPLVATPAYASVAQRQPRGGAPDDEPSVWLSAALIDQRNRALIHVFMGLAATGALD